MTVEEQVIGVVAKIPGVTGVELVSALSGKWPDCDISEILENLVKDKQIVEVMYMIPPMENQIKTMYFPIGTEVRIRVV